MTNAQQKNKRLLWLLLVAGIAMFVFAFALIPLYRMLCQVTGINGKYYSIDEVQQTVQIDPTRTLSVTFVSSKNEKLPWDFYPNHPVVKLHPGEARRVSYHARNRTIHPMTVQAIPSILPGIAAKYIHKTECFCFKQQIFQAGEVMDMPILFHVDPDLPANIKNITISYTLFAAEMTEAKSLTKIGHVN